VKVERMLTRNDIIIMVHWTGALYRFVFIAIFHAILSLMKLATTK
jgi:hypothetical protein